MKVRLIKHRMPAAKQKHIEPVEIPIIDTIRSWVHEFQATKANRVRLDFKRISKPGEVSNGGLG